MQRSIDLTLSILASAVGFGLSWPFWRSFSYFAESHAAWWVYFVLGYLLAVYVFYVFFRALRTMFKHEGHDHGAHGHEGHDHEGHDHAGHAHHDHARPAGAEEYR